MNNKPNIEDYRDDADFPHQYIKDCEAWNSEQDNQPQPIAVTLRSCMRDYVKPGKVLTIDDCLANVTVEPLPMLTEDEQWYGVFTPLGQFASFPIEGEAFRYRFDLINRILND